MRKIRVLHVIDKLETGGAQMVLRDLLQLNRRNNVEFYLCVLRNSINEIDINFKNVIRLSEGKYDPRSFWRLYSISKKLSIDILHLHLLKSSLLG